MVTMGDLQTLTRLRDLVASILDIDPAEVHPEASFYAELAMDSLQKTEVIVRIEQDFGLVLTPEQAAAAQSVADLVRLMSVAR